MRRTRSPLIPVLLAAALAWSCSGTGRRPPEPASDASPVEQLWIDFCHYVVIASPDLAAAYGRQLLDEASPQQLRALLAWDDPATRRAIRLLDESELPDQYPDLGGVWARLRVRARPDRDADS